MSTTTTRPREEMPDSGRARGAAGRVATKPAVLLGLALGAAIVYAAFASGAIGLQDESKLQVGIAAISLGTVAALMFGRGLGVSAERGTVAGIGLLVGFAAWCGLSISWSVAPDESWIELNRAIAYAMCAGLAVVLGSSLPFAARRVGTGYVAIATAVALYALGGKVVPWVSVPGVFDLNQTELIARLRAPLEYWNALALFCALAVPIALGNAADVEGSARRRVLSLLALVPLLATIGLTYSRGGLIVVVLAVGLLMLLRRDSARIAAFFAVGVVAVVPAFVTVLVRSDLTTDGLSVSSRTDGGLLLLLALVAGTAIALVAGGPLVRAGERVRLGPRGRVLAPRVAAALVALAAVGFVGKLATSDRGVTGSISHSWEGFTKAKRDRQNAPGRLVETNSGNRWVWWNEAVGAWWDRPVVGHGAGSFPVIHKRYRHDRLEVRQPHSVPLEFLAETGLVGGGLAFGGLGLLGLAGVRRYRNLDPSGRAAAAPLLAGVAAWGVHMWVDWDWDIPAVTLPMLVFLGVLAARPRAEPAPAGHERRSLASRVAVLGAGTVVGGAFLLSAVFPALADSWNSQALTEASKGDRADLADAAKKAASAKRLNPFSIEPVFTYAVIARQRGQLKLSGQLYAEALRRQPNNPNTWARVAVYQVAAGNLPAAQRSAQALLKLDPLALTTFFLVFTARTSPAVSATAPGTPLPADPFRPAPLPKPTPAPRAPAPKKGARKPAKPRPQATPRTPTPTPAPTPAPQPRSTPTPKNDSGGKPFTLDN